MECIKRSLQSITATLKGLSYRPVHVSPTIIASRCRTVFHTVREGSTPSLKDNQHVLLLLLKRSQPTRIRVAYLPHGERSDHIQQVCGLSLVDCVQCVIAGVLGDVAVEGHTVRYW